MTSSLLLGSSVTETFRSIGEGKYRTPYSSLVTSECSLETEFHKLSHNLIQILANIS